MRAGTKQDTYYSCSSHRQLHGWNLKPKRLHTLLTLRRTRSLCFAVGCHAPLSLLGLASIRQRRSP